MPSLHHNSYYYSFCIEALVALLPCYFSIDSVLKKLYSFHNNFEQILKWKVVNFKSKLLILSIF